MTINYNVTGTERKKLVQAIAQILECESKYLGVPSCAYQVDYFTISKDGVLSFRSGASGAWKNLFVHRKTNIIITLTISGSKGKALKKSNPPPLTNTTSNLFGV